MRIFLIRKIIFKNFNFCFLLPNAALCQSTRFPNGTAKVDIILKKQTFFRKNRSFFLPHRLEEAGVIIVQLLQNMANHDVTDKSRFVAHTVLFTVLVDERKLLLVEENGLPVATDQFSQFLAPEVRFQIVLL